MSLLSQLKTTQIQIQKQLKELEQKEFEKIAKIVEDKVVEPVLKTTDKILDEIKEVVEKFDEKVEAKLQEENPIVKPEETFSIVPKTEIKEN